MIGRLLEVGVAVDDVGKASDRFASRLNAPLTDLIQAPIFAMAFKMCRLGDVDFEVMEATAASGPIYNFVSKRGVGLHHVAFLVEDIDAVVTDFKARGVALAQDEPVALDNLRAIFVHPSATAGVLVEFVENLHPWAFGAPPRPDQPAALPIAGFGAACDDVDAAAAAFAGAMGGDVGALYHDSELGRSRDVAVSGVPFQFFHRDYSRLPPAALAKDGSGLHHVVLGSVTGLGSEAGDAVFSDPAKCYGVCFRESRAGA